MYPHKFIMHYKCECYGRPHCNCPRKSASSAYFLENISDIAETLTEIMMICGIHQCKAKGAVDIIIYSFLHYDEIRHRIDAVPRKRLCKEDLIHDLGRKCLMTRMEAQLTYSIIKRAFKAFYHGTSEGGIKNRALDAEAIHTSECLWVHAAKRTAQVFAIYEGMFFTAQKNYEAQIRCAYKRLFDRLQSRKYPSEDTMCACKTCFKGNEAQLKIWHSTEVADTSKEVIVDPSDPPRTSKEYKEQVLKTTSKQELQFQKSHASSRRCDMSMLTDKQMIPEECSRPICNLGVLHSASVQSKDTRAEQIDAEKASKVSLNLPRCYKCNCPKLVCDCDIDLVSGTVSAECSQGPFTCRWVRVDEEKPEDRPDPCLTRPEEHECPVDCYPTTSQLTCNIECECDCEVCECIEEDSSGYDDENEPSDNLVFEHEEEAVFEDTETDSVKVDIPDISTLRPNELFAGCRVQMNHVVEETSSTINPASIAKVEVHRIEASIRSEPVNLSKNKLIVIKEAISKNTLKSQKGSGEGLPPKKSVNLINSQSKEDAQRKKEEAAAVSKILGELI